MTSCEETDPLLSIKQTRPYSIDKQTGEVKDCTPAQLGRQYLFDKIPFVAISGLQRKERAMSSAFSVYIGNLTTMGSGHKISLEKKDAQKRRASAAILRELDVDRQRGVTFPLLHAVSIACLMQFNVGFNIGSMNPTERSVFPNHGILSWSLAVSFFPLGGIFGAILAGRVADLWGRRVTILVATYSFLVGGLLQALSWNMTIMIGSRLIIGLGSGLSSFVVPIYVGEIAPPNLRGTFGTLMQFSLVIGILASFVLAFLLATSAGWRWFFSITAVIATVQLLMTPCLLESPRFLLTNDPHSKEARKIIGKLRGLRTREEVEAEVARFVRAGISQDADSSEKPTPIAHTMEDTNARRSVITTIFLQAARQLCGINAVFYYSTVLFDGIVENPLLGTAMLALVNAIATYGALSLLNHYARKTLILVSSMGMLLSCIVVIMARLEYFQNAVAFIAVNVYVVFFNVGLGPVPSLIAAEMFHPTHVAASLSLSIRVQGFCHFIVAFAFPYFITYLGPYSFGPFAAVLLMILIFVLCYMPETKGILPQELLALITESNKNMAFHGMNGAIEDVVLDLDWK